MGFKESSEPTKMIVIADGDMIKNRYNASEGYGYPLGFDHYTNTQYANKEFLLNAINYLTGDQDFMESRSRDIKLRKLDPVKIKEQRLTYQCINIILPSLLLIIAGVVIYFVRSKKYSSKK